MSKTNFYNKQYKSDSVAKPDFERLIRISRALLKFCLDYGYLEQSEDIENIKECVSALEMENIGDVKRAFARIHFGKEGFNEWWPGVVCENEDSSYVKAIYDGLWLQVRSEIRNAPPTS